MSNDTRKVALIFGGSRGIGAAIASRFAHDGYAVAFTYVARADKASALAASITAGGGDALAIQADSADAGAIRAAVAAAVARYGALDAVVVNAGLYRHNVVDAVPLAELDLLLDVNVRGVYLAIQAAVPHLKRGGRVITIGSNTAIRTGSAGASVYQMTKGAVAAMVKGLALDLAARGITVNNVQPGPTRTDINAGRVDMIAGMTALKRIGEPDEIAGLVAYIARDEAGYMTGASITIDGGFVL
jgi:3-oxoacyl-[acyl-carrier protein] reductase